MTSVGSIAIAMQNAISGMQVTQSALQTTSNNIANANNEDYSRKVVNQEARTILGSGAGVQIASITRVVNEFLQTELRDSAALLGKLEELNDYFQRTQNMFGTLNDDNSIARTIGAFSDAVQELTVSPEGLSQQLNVINAAGDFVRQINQMANDLQDLRLQADREISAAVTLINEQAAIVNTLNAQIAKNIATNQPAGDLEDQRDAAIRKISAQIDVVTFKRDSGEVVVLTSRGRTLVDRTVKTLTHPSATAINADLSYSSGGIPGITFDNGTDITSEVTSGRLASLIDVRDNRVPDLTAELSQLADIMGEQINAAHNSGSAFPPPNSLTGTHTFTANDIVGITGTISGHVRISVIDASGNYATDGSGNADSVDIDLAALTAANGGTLTVQNVIDAINTGLTNGTASINNSNQLVISGGGIVIDSDGKNFTNAASSISSGGTTRNFSQFFGLNDFFDMKTNYESYLSDPQTSSTYIPGVAGTLTFTYDVSGTATTRTVAYTGTQSLTDIAAAINADSGLTSANITASLLTDGSFVRLKIEDTDDNNFLLSDSGTLLTTLDFKADNLSAAEDIAIRTSLVNDSTLLARAQMATSSVALTGQDAVTNGLTGQGYVVTYNSTVAVNGDSYRLSYDRTGGENMTLTNLSTGTSQTIDVTSLIDAQASGGAGSNLAGTETAIVNFSTIGVNVTLNSTFNRTADNITSGALNTVASTNVTVNTALTMTKDVDGGVTNAGLTELLAAGSYAVATGRLTVTTASTGVGNLTIGTSAGLEFSVDGAAYAATSATNLDDGAAHTILVRLATSDQVIGSIALNDVDSNGAGAGTMVFNMGNLMFGQSSTPAVGESAITAGDNSVSLAMSNKFTQSQTFLKAGSQAEGANTLGGYAASILGNNSIQASATKSEVAFRQTIVENLKVSNGAVSGVNVDEELANMIVLQNAFTAAARMITVTAELLDTLIDIVR